MQPLMFGEVEFTPALYESGTCHAGNYRFCLVVVFRTVADLDVAAKSGALRHVVEEFSKETSDPLRVVYTVLEKKLSWAVLDNLLAATGLHDQALGPAGAFLWRPRWGRFELFRGS